MRRLRKMKLLIVHWHNRSVCCTIMDIIIHYYLNFASLFSWAEQSSNHLSLFP